MKGSMQTKKSKLLRKAIKDHLVKRGAEKDYEHVSVHQKTCYLQEAIALADGKSHACAVCEYTPAYDILGDIIDELGGDRAVSLYVNEVCGLIGIDDVQFYNFSVLLAKKLIARYKWQEALEDPRGQCET